MLFRPKRIGNAVSYRVSVPYSDRVEVALWRRAARDSERPA